MFEGKENGRALSAIMRLEIDQLKHSIVTHITDVWDSELEPVVGKAIRDCLLGYEDYIQQEVPKLVQRQVDEILRVAVKNALTENWSLRFEIEERVKLKALEEIHKIIDKEINGKI